MNIEDEQEHHLRDLVEGLRLLGAVERTNDLRDSSDSLHFK